MLYYRVSYHNQYKCEVLLGIRLLRTTLWCGLSNHQAATAQMHLVGKFIVECRPLPRSTSPFSEVRRPGTDHDREELGQERRRAGRGRRKTGRSQTIGIYGGAPNAERVTDGDVGGEANLI